MERPGRGVPDQAIDMREPVTPIERAPKQDLPGSEVFQDDVLVITLRVESDGDGVSGRAPEAAHLDANSGVIIRPARDEGRDDGQVDRDLDPPCVREPG